MQLTTQTELTPTSNEIHLWSVQMAQWRKVKAQGIYLLDSTAMTGITAFAPLMSDVKLYKSGQLSEDDYTKIYLARMAESKTLYPKRWVSFTRHPKLAVACYCKAGAFCHRHLLIPLIQEYLISLNFQVHLHGEIQ